MKKRVVLIGAGNLGFHLGVRLHESSEAEVIQVITRSENNAQQLTQKISSSFATDFSKIETPLDLVILAVKDDSIGKVVDELAHYLPPEVFIAHTSGATSMDVFKNYFKNAGILYLLQTFTTGRKPIWDEIPVFIDASNRETLDILDLTARALSPNVHKVSEEQRKSLHVAAVFANNFSNHLYAIASEILKADNLDFDLIRPLIKETAAKISDSEPTDVQTGPAARADRKTIESHLKYLEKFPVMHKIYLLLTESIELKR